MDKFYNEQSFGSGAGSLQSGKSIVPIVLEMLHPKSVVDVGCGVGGFLSVFKEMGVNDILGIDGPWTSRERLRIPENLFLEGDLEKPLNIGRNFDLAVSLEVAEHLDPGSAVAFVNSLTSFAPVVLFSAAVPYQGGLNHINEQWPDYWVKLFGEKDFVPIDCIRRKIWTNDKIGWWYRQNILLFVKKDYLATNPRLQKEYEQTEPSALAMIHPELYRRKVEENNIIDAIKWIRMKIRKMRERKKS